ncbi:hypothetical protein MAPG_00215 [Magnaporthiopsis poae ATCC 64411]|uniref:Feruloyl esterase C n=1 Tax=Magnaporthiopsis poae (strain ATCC 64411 / 73-15) TaxID=644358 RepID=A0A0C4DKE6_MAGP6|nr:hypothetical protein MAPG_00215 [Magnaporthiopsis poae ATCC 64411]
MVTLKALLGLALTLTSHLAAAEPLHYRRQEDVTVAANPSSGCGKAPALTSGTKSISVNGRNRQYVLRVPNNYDRSKTYRLIFAFHWVGGTMRGRGRRRHDRELWSYYGMQRSANETAILVAPQGLGNGWANSGGEDIAFVDAMVSQLQNGLCVDTRQLLVRPVWFMSPIARNFRQQSRSTYTSLQKQEISK